MAKAQVQEPPSVIRTRTRRAPPKAATAVPVKAFRKPKPVEEEVPVEDEDEEAVHERLHRRGVADVEHRVDRAVHRVGDHRLVREQPLELLRRGVTRPSSGEQQQTRRQL